MAQCSISIPPVNVMKPLVWKMEHWAKMCSFAEAYLGICQISMMEFFSKKGYFWKLINDLFRKSILGNYFRILNTPPISECLRMDAF